MEGQAGSAGVTETVLHLVVCRLKWGRLSGHPSFPTSFLLPLFDRLPPLRLLLPPPPRSLLPPPAPVLFHPAKVVSFRSRFAAPVS